MVLPFVVNLVVRVLDLKGYDRWHLPGRIERERLFGADGANQEIIEQMPLALPGCFVLRVCHFGNVSSRIQRKEGGRTCH